MQHSPDDAVRSPCSKHAVPIAASKICQNSALGSFKVDNRKQILSQCMQLYALKQQHVKTCLQSFEGSEGNPRPGLSQVVMLDC